MKALLKSLGIATISLLTFFLLNEPVYMTVGIVVAAVIGALFLLVSLDRRAPKSEDDRGILWSLLFSFMLGMMWPSVPFICAGAWRQKAAFGDAKPESQPAP